ncbi:MAG: hypothetical protein Q8P41_27530 [Pseudomonadota bacterium]|nr:hypothetical protein [Pseudomonadota bacterium]
MLLSFLLAACVEPEPPKSDPPPITPGAPPCEETTPAETPLGWSEPGPTGLSAADVLGFAIGRFSNTLAWDDGTTTTATLEVTPVSAVQTTVGPQETCPLAVTGFVTWTLSTEDGRLADAGDAAVSVEDAAFPARGLSITDTLDAATLRFAPLAPGESTLYLRGFLDNDGALVSLVIEEVWPLGMDTNRVCVRGSLDPTVLACHDSTEGAGPD